MTLLTILLQVNKQWGANLSCTRGGTKTISFPIAFNTCFTVLGQDNGSGNGQDNSIVRSFSASSFSWYSGATTTMNFVAIGKQLQWGTSSSTSRDTKVTYPLNFNTLFAVCGSPKTSSNLSGSQSNFGIKSQSTTGFIANIYDNGSGYAGFNWIAAGK